MVENDLVNSVDAFGLDRYITQFDICGAGGTGETNLHVGLAVDKWKVVNGKYVKDGQVTFNFSVDYLTEDEEGFDWWNIVMGGIYGRGRIEEDNGLKLDSPITVESSPCQDIKMLEMLRDEAKDPPFYNAIFHQCVFWSVGALQYGMDEPDVKKCCNPDGTPYAY